MSGIDVVAMVGTDHHPFDRFVAWIDAAAARHPEHRFLVQHGATRPPSLAEGVDFLPAAQLQQLMPTARVVICHGGPGSIMDARAAGHIPICVPRNPALGEHVDGHQLRFAEVVRDSGVVRLPSDEGDFRVMLADALSVGLHDPVTWTSEAAGGTARAAAILDDLMITKPRRGGWRRGHQSSTLGNSFGRPPQ
ncbi:MAG: glycosyltransferase [Nocardioides sp.]